MAAYPEKDGFWTIHPFSTRMARPKGNASVLWRHTVDGQVLVGACCGAPADP